MLLKYQCIPIIPHLYIQKGSINARTDTLNDLTAYLNRTKIGTIYMLSKQKNLLLADLKIPFTPLLRIFLFVLRLKCN